MRAALQTRVAPLTLSLRIGEGLAAVRGRDAATRHERLRTTKTMKTKLHTLQGLVSLVFSDHSYIHSFPALHAFIQALIGMHLAAVDNVRVAAIRMHISHAYLFAAV